MTSSKLVQLTKADSVFEAHAIRGFLESHNIKCIIADEHLVNANWAIKHAIGDIRLNVYAHDIEKAKMLLENTGSTEDEPSPNTKTEETKPQKTPIIKWLISIFLTIFMSAPIPFKNRKKNR
jgi:hypothetical protein